MMLIEFCGAPGCGKSTLCDRLESEIKKRNLTAINLQKEQKVSNAIQKVKKGIEVYLFPLVYCFAPCNRSLRKEIKKLTSIRGRVHRTLWHRRILKMNYRLCRAKRKQYDFILLDEGIIQFLTSLSDGRDIDDAYLSAVRFLISDIYPAEYVILYCYLSSEENIERLIKRNRIHDHFVSQDSEEMENRLRLKISNIEKCVAVFPPEKVAHIDVHDSISALEKILNRL